MISKHEFELEEIDDPGEYEYEESDDDEESTAKAPTASIDEVNLMIQREIEIMSGMNAYKELTKNSSEHRVLITVLKELNLNPRFDADTSYYIVKALGILVPKLTDPSYPYEHQGAEEEETFVNSLQSETKAQITALLERIETYLAACKKEQEAQYQIDKQAKQAKQREAEQKYTRFLDEEDETKVSLRLEAYQKVANALLIGGMASASKPYKHGDPMPSPELRKAVESLKKKHAPQFKELKLRYEPIHSEIPLRYIYNGIDNVFRGAQYSQLRIKKYLDRVGMKEAIIEGIRQELLEETPCELKHLLQKAVDDFQSQLSTLDDDQVMAQCVNRLATAFLNHDPKPTETADESFIMMQTIALIEMTKTIKERKEHKLSLTAYYKIMAILNVAIINQLSLTPTDSREKERFFNQMTSHVGETLVANSGRDALCRSLKALGMMGDLDSKLPGFPLEGALKGSVRKGYFEWINGEEVNHEDTCALIGRDSETLYDLDVNSDEFKDTIEKIKSWATSAPTPKTLVVDISIPSIEQPDPILTKMIALHESLLAKNSAFDILVVRSEQKQQSLGTGKFAAGSSFLITDDADRRRKFDDEAKKPRTMDQKLATFYRENVSDSIIALIKEQAESAKKFAEKNHHSGLIVNGPFILEQRNTHASPTDQEGYSFGFVVKNWTSWEVGQKRIDPGILADPEEYQDQLERSEIGSKFRS